MIETEIKKQEYLPPVEVGTKSDIALSDDRLRQLGEYLKNRLDKLKKLRENSDWEKEKADAFEAYHMMDKKRVLPFPGASNLSSPLTRIGVDAFHANVMSSMFSNGTSLKVKPVITNKDFSNSADKAAKYMTYVMNNEADFYMVFDDADKKAQMYGIGYLEPTYIKEDVWETAEVKETVQNPELDPVTQQVVMRESTRTKKVKKKRTVFDGVKIQSIPVESIYKNPFTLTIDQSVREDVVFKVFQCSFSDIKDRSKKESDRPAYYISSQVSKIEPLVVDKIMKSLSDLEQSRARLDGFYLDMLFKENMVDMAEAHCWYDIDGDNIKEEITAVFQPDSGIVVRVSFTKCRIVELLPRPIDGRGYGEGIPKICKRLDEEWENFHNTRANAGQWENTPFFFYRAGGRLNPQTLILKPGHGYPVDDPREIAFPQTQRTGSSFYQEEGLIINYFERIFAIDENIQGVASSRSQTATETLRVSSKASVRFANPFNRTVTAVNKLLSHVWELNQECAPAMKEFYVVGEGGNVDFDKMTMRDFQSKLKFSIEVSSIFDQQLMRDTMLLAYRMYIVNPMVQQHPEIMWELSQKTLNTLNVGVDLPKPDQAKTLSPFEEHEMFQMGQDPEPQVGEDVEHHLKVHMKQLNDESIKEWDPQAVKYLILHIDKTKILDATLKSANLNNSGMFTGNPMMPQPGMTSNRNPTQMFNTMKIAESSKSMMKNNRNGSQNMGGGQNAQQNLDQTFGNTIS